MTSGPALVDTNVIVAGLLTSDSSSPTAGILDRMLAGRFRYLLSSGLLAEYREVLLRPRIQRRHRLDAAEVDVLLTDIAANGIWLELASQAERRGDQHLQDILSAVPSAILVTGDLKRARRLGKSATVFTPRAFKNFLGD